MTDTEAALIAQEMDETERRLRYCADVQRAVAQDWPDRKPTNDSLMTENRYQF